MAVRRDSTIPEMTPPPRGRIRVRRLGNVVRIDLLHSPRLTLLLLAGAAALLLVAGMVALGVHRSFGETWPWYGWALIGFAIVLALLGWRLVGAAAVYRVTHERLYLTPKRLRHEWARQGGQTRTDMAADELKRLELVTLPGDSETAKSLVLRSRDQAVTIGEDLTSEELKWLRQAIATVLGQD